MKCTLEVRSGDTRQNPLPKADAHFVERDKHRAFTKQIRARSDCPFPPEPELVNGT